MPYCVQVLAALAGEGEGIFGAQVCPEANFSPLFLGWPIKVFFVLFFLIFVCLFGCVRS